MIKSLTRLSFMYINYSSLVLHRKPNQPSAGSSLKTCTQCGVKLVFISSECEIESGRQTDTNECALMTKAIPNSPHTNVIIHLQVIH